MLVRMMSRMGISRAARLPAFAFLVLSFFAATWSVAASGNKPQPLPKPMPVVASFSVLGDMVAEIGGDYVKVTNIIGLGGDAHSFEPTPEQVRSLSSARVLFINGLGFEAWLPRLVASSSFKGLTVVASDGVKPRKLDSDHADHDGHSHAGDIDPHAWQSLTNGMIYARNIAAGLAKADPAHAADYTARAGRYIEEMKKLDAEVRQALGHISPDKRKVVVPHDSLGYFGADYGIQFIPIMGISNKAEASARDVAAIVDQVRKIGGAAVFLESSANPKMAEQIARETGAKVGGTLYVDTLSESDQPAGSYLGMFKWNAGQLIYVLKPNGK
ncbi:MAG TPA: metal ABC transporter substrate-binding protein [Pusillimonas sp.]|uniref:metal ABC transporter substrate-binding protein n=1 Tax=Pusillimonas sp. TaxID=3040095 RepID=UPI002CA36114|nr:metal ABC transporter substrate-binding protein [Pusillimonas sp.]HUH87897.1 metal ABC transporter substrate-binding protein [Pusillimonas sp.]